MAHKNNIDLVFMFFTSFSKWFELGEVLYLAELSYFMPNHSGNGEVITPTRPATSLQTYLVVLTMLYIIGVHQRKERPPKTTFLMDEEG
jgi:hypothetical protein